MKHAETVTFAGSHFDRAAHLRPSSSQFLRDQSATLIFIWRGRPLLDDQTRALVKLSSADPFFVASQMKTVFLGLVEGAPFFAVSVPDWPQSNTEDAGQTGFLDDSETSHPDLPDTYKFCDLRANMTLLSPLDASLASAMRGVLEWHRSHQFCANCGEKSDLDMAGWQTKCPACERSHFPRTDPVVIMLITKENDTLLGRASSWPEGMYSCLAGFMEPGETVEAAVRREALEETGTQISDVRYVSSQPWVFPSSLMIGCVATAINTDLILDPVEIEHAKWVSRETLCDAFAGKNVGLKPARSGSIASFLLRNWLQDTLD